MRPTLRERALRLLALREYARAGLARKLAAHAGSVDELEALLDDLSQSGLLSDARYMELRVRTRGARYGNARLAQELGAAGVDKDLVESGLAVVGDELARAREVWQRKFGTQGGASDAAERSRQTNFLMRRGFSGETIRRVLRGDHDDD